MGPLIGLYSSYWTVQDSTGKSKSYGGGDGEEIVVKTVSFKFAFTS